MKFMVIVNQKYLVTVEANTHGGAEHKILDNVYYGIQTCQAFSMSELSTDIFKSLAEDCETIGYSELFDKAKEHKKTIEEIKAENDKIAAYKKQIEAMEKRMAEIKSEIKISEENIENLANKQSNIW